MNDSESRDCKCGQPERWVADPHFPVEFDEEMNEYHLRHGKARALMRYCFWCGGRLPESNRGSFFTIPSEAEKSEVYTILADARSLHDVFRILGPPDETVDAGGRIENTKSGEGYSYSQHHRYSQRWKTLELIVHTAPQNRFGYIIGGHPIADRRTKSDPV